MGLILSQSWREHTASDINPRGTPLPRHAVPCEIPYHSAIVKHELVAGSVILPVCHFTGLDSSGNETGHTHDVYGQVLVSSTGLQKLKEAGILDEESPVYKNMDECRTRINDLNMAAHETYLDGYGSGKFADIAAWRQEQGAAMRAGEITARATITPPTLQKLYS